MLNKIMMFLALLLAFQTMQITGANLSENLESKREYAKLVVSLKRSLDDSNERSDDSNGRLIYSHVIENVSNDGSLVELEDGFTFKVNWWYRKTPQQWKKGDRIYITYDFDHQQLKLEHTIFKEVVWATASKDPDNIPTIKSLPNGAQNPDRYTKIGLSNGYVFKGSSFMCFADWHVKDRVIILANPDGFYQVWNLDRRTIQKSELVGNRTSHESEEPLEFNDILGLEARLNQHVLQQFDATEAVATSILIYSAGLKVKERPIGVFLFLGPTGVGKTELAKALTKDIYKDLSSLLRFDMSHFTEPHSVARLIGSPPGYVNHEEGGQLTEPLLDNSGRVVLLDEIEKAHSQVHKAFLPIFDEGYILDSKNNRVECSNTIFIMTSNLCGSDIAELFNLGYTAEEILPIIEPQLIEALSPELYNRVEPVLFQPLKKETMGVLVDLLLNQLVDRMWIENKISVHFDDSLKNYLMEEGFHPKLGARPLKRLIEKRVVATLAFGVIHDNVKSGSSVTLIYDQGADKVILIQE